MNLQHLYQSQSGLQWQKLGKTPCHGVDVPLFSIWSLKSAGIGEFRDLILLASFLKKVGFNTLQLLPLNDTGLETSPYSALSAFALNPLHLTLSSLPYLDENSTLKHELKELQGLNHLTRIDYPLLHEKRSRFLQDYFAFAGQRIENSNEYRNFVQTQPWIRPYALFKSIKILTLWHCWEKWPKELGLCSQRELELLEKKFESEIHFHTLLQYLCYIDLKQVKKEINEMGVYLMGDIPILINRESADVWFYPNLFDLNSAAGAPPDQYSHDGQYWGFPPYNWENHAADNYKWWRARLDYAANFYDLYRIDHVVGFFRLWTIPLNSPATSGKFNPENSNDWIPHGKNLMEMMLECKAMLPIGEDLGTVPDEVRASLKELGISGTKVMRWERFWHGDRSYIPISDYPLESLTTVSTHDSEPLGLWWKDQKEEAMLFASMQGWEYHPDLSDEQRYQILKMSHNSNSFFHINLLSEYLALNKDLCDLNGSHERINIPGTVSEQNWSCKTKTSLEEILANENLQKSLTSLIR